MMKRLVVALCLLGVAYAEVSLQAVFQAKWSAFKAAHGKTYAPHEEQKRLNAFLSNTLHIETHNERFSQGLESFQMGHNQLSDMTLEEFRRTKTGFQASRSNDEFGNTTVFRASAVGNIPSSADFSKHTPVIHDQGQCGSCYTFSAVGALEGILARKTNRLYSFSEQELVDCSGVYGNGGCHGGQMVTCFQYIQSMGGLSTKSSYPYAGEVQACQSYIARDRRAVPANIVRVPPNEQSVTAALFQVGPLSVAVFSGNRAWQLYKGGIVTSQACGVNGPDHAVVLVGYGVENGVPFYKIKNSWSPGWGEGGYMRLARDSCKVTADVCYPAFY